MKKYWAQHILCFSAAVLFATAALAADRREFGAEDFKEFTAPTQDLQQAMDGVAGSFQQSPTDIEAFRMFQKKDKELLDIYEKYYGVQGKPQAPARQNKFACDNPVEVDYFFSFAMPESSIQAAVADALAMRKDCVKVHMYLRGLVDNDLKKTISTFYSLSKANPQDLPIQIDPVKFKKEDIQVTPTTIVKGKRFTGDMRLSGILYNLDALQDGKVAVTYPVKEEDLAELFKKRASLAEKKMQNYVESGKVLEKYKLTRYDGQFSEVTNKRTYYIDPTQTLEEDIRDQNGLILFPRGTRVNPLDQIGMGRYIFIDGRNAKQVEMAIQGNYRKIILMSGDAHDLGRKYKRNFYHAIDELVNLFRVERVPLAVEQEGRLVRATELPL